jgi:outer membrane murein-binding lipoprotein Lpp
VGSLILQKETDMAEQDLDTSASSVPDLLVKLHDNIDSINQCIQGLSDTSSHSAELDRLSSEREAKIAELRAAHEEAVKALSSQRELEEQELAARRKKEQEELEETRRRELRS